MHYHTFVDIYIIRALRRITVAKQTLHHVKACVNVKKC